MSASDNKSHLTTIAIVFAVAITCVAISLRFLAKNLQKIPLGPDDLTMVIGAVSSKALPKEGALKLAALYNSQCTCLCLE